MHIVEVMCLILVSVFAITVCPWPQATYFLMCLDNLSKKRVNQLLSHIQLFETQWTIAH